MVGGDARARRRVRAQVSGWQSETSREQPPPPCQPPACPRHALTPRQWFSWLGMAVLPWHRRRNDGFPACCTPSPRSHPVACTDLCKGGHSCAHKQLSNPACHCLAPLCAPPHLFHWQLALSPSYLLDKLQPKPWREAAELPSLLNPSPRTAPSNILPCLQPSCNQFLPHFPFLWQLIWMGVQRTGQVLLIGIKEMLLTDKSCGRATCVASSHSASSDRPQGRSILPGGHPGPLPAALRCLSCSSDPYAPPREPSWSGKVLMKSVP